MPCLPPISPLLRPNIASQMSIESLTPYGHFQLIEWILGHVIGIELVDFS